MMDDSDEETREHEPQDQALIDAILQGDLKQVTLLLQGNDEWAPADVNLQDDGIPALHLAIHSHNDPENTREIKKTKKAIVSVLLKHGADVNALDYSHSTALHYAAAQPDADLVQCLIDADRDVITTLRVQDVSGMIPLQFAIYHNYINNGRLLIEAGTDISQAVDDQTFLNLAQSLYPNGLPDEWKELLTPDPHVVYGGDLPPKGAKGANRGCR